MEYLQFLITLDCMVLLHSRVTVETRGNSTLLCLDKQEIPIPAEYEFLFPVINCAKETPVLIDELSDTVFEQYSFKGMTLFYRLLDYLNSGGVLLFQIPGIIEVSLMNTKPGRNKPVILPNKKYRLSSFSFMRNKIDGLYLESALCPVRVRVLDDRFTGLIIKKEGVTLDEVENCDDIIKSKLKNALLLLLYYGVLIESESDEEDLRYWEFHDLLLHGRSRAGSNVGGFGPTYRFESPAPPALVAPSSDSFAVYLDKPDVEYYMSKSPTFFSITENRFSHRDYSAEPLELSVLAALLYLSSRVKNKYDTESYEATSRPYPGGGGLYELELYLSINRCRDVKSGVYRYSPETHSLHLVCEPNALTHRLWHEAAQSAQCDNFHVLLNISARIDRVMWKYEAIAYSLILKDCGVFMQNFCLACSALGLGSCMLGAGSSHTLSAITGRDIYLEAPVGELVFGVPSQDYSNGDLP